MLCQRAAMKGTYVEQWSKCFFFHILQKWKGMFLCLCNIITFKTFLRWKVKSQKPQWRERCRLYFSIWQRSRVRAVAARFLCCSITESCPAPRTEHSHWWNENIWRSWSFRYTFGSFFFFTFGTFLSALTVPIKHIKEEKLSKFLIVITWIITDTFSHSFCSEDSEFTHLLYIYNIYI